MQGQTGQLRNGPVARGLVKSVAIATPTQPKLDEAAVVVVVVVVMRPLGLHERAKVKVRGQGLQPELRQGGGGGTVRG